MKWTIKQAPIPEKKNPSRLDTTRVKPVQGTIEETELENQIRSSSPTVKVSVNIFPNHTACLR